jgi:hypothetical protein
MGQHRTNQTSRKQARKQARRGGRIDAAFVGNCVGNCVGPLESCEPAHVLMARAANQWANHRWKCMKCGLGAVDSPHTRSIAVCDACLSSRA